MNKNPYDKQIEELFSLFYNIPNFDKIREVPLMSKMFDSLAAKMVEINNLRELFKNFYCPAAKKCIAKQKKLVKKSIYLKLDTDIINEIDDTFYFTIRMGYVQLFHYIESFVNNLFEQTNALCAEDEFPTIEEYFQKHYNFKIRKHWKRMDNVVEKVNWICNRVKHDDGFPNNNTDKWPIYYLVKPIPFEFNEKERLKIEIDEFEKDTNEVLNFFSGFSSIIINTYMIMLIPKFINLSNVITQNINPDIDSYRNLLLETQQTLIDNISHIINLHRQIGIEDY